MTLGLTGIGPGPRALTPLTLTPLTLTPLTLTPLTLTAQMQPSDLPAYGRLPLDVLHGNAALSIRGDEAEESWRVLAPVMAAWSTDLIPLHEYPAGLPTW